MEIKKIDEKELVISQRKKRNRDSKKTIFEIYKSEKTVKDYMFHLKDFLHFVYDGENDFSISIPFFSLVNDQIFFINLLNFHTLPAIYYIFFISKFYSKKSIHTLS